MHHPSESFQEIYRDFQLFLDHVRGPHRIVVVCPVSQAKVFHGMYENPMAFIQVPLQVAAEREITRYYYQKVTLNSIKTETMTLASAAFLPAMPQTSDWV